jgi:hypothetical protein
MKVLGYSSVILSLFSLSACNIYLKDMVDGSPYERSYDETYKQAITEGMNHETAHRRALLAGSSNHKEVWEARHEEEREDEEWDDFMGEDSSDEVKLRWN